MTIKIQINSLEALERLIGNDNELEIDIRQNVVDAFTKKHLKTIANDELMIRAKNAVTNTISEEFMDKVIFNHRPTDVFKKDIVDDFKRRLRTEANMTLIDIVDEVIESTKAYERVKETVESAVLNITDKIIYASSEANINRLVDKKLKERLGL